MGPLVGQHHSIAQVVKEFRLQREIDGGKGAVAVKGQNDPPGSFPLRRKKQSPQLQAVMGGKLQGFHRVFSDPPLGLPHSFPEGVPDGAFLLILLISPLLRLPENGEPEKILPRPQQGQHQQQENSQ